MNCDVGEATVTRRKGWRMSRDVGEVTERLENELCILHLFFRFFYVTGSSLTSPSELPMKRDLEICKSFYYMPYCCLNFKAVHPLLTKYSISNLQRIMLCIRNLLFAGITKINVQYTFRNQLPYLMFFSVYFNCLKNLRPLDSSFKTNVLTNWLLRNPEVYYHPYINLILDPILSNIYPISSITIHLPQIHFNIILPSTSWPP